MCRRQSDFALRRQLIGSSGPRPDEFKLSIPRGEIHQIHQDCRVVWREEALIGLVFEPTA
jgi:hypothetical protein